MYGGGGLKRPTSRAYVGVQGKLVRGSHFSGFRNYDHSISRLLDLSTLDALEAMDSGNEELCLVWLGAFSCT